jgi:hypothetical protein
MVDEKDPAHLKNGAPGDGGGLAQDPPQIGGLAVEPRARSSRGRGRLGRPYAGSGFLLGRMAAPGAIDNRNNSWVNLGRVLALP